MFSELPKLFDKQFIIGFLIPVVVFQIAFQLVIKSWSDARALATGVWEDKNIGALALTVAFLWLEATVLMLINRLVYRFFSGYCWPLTIWWGKKRLLKNWDLIFDRLIMDEQRLAGQNLGPAIEYEIQSHNQRVYEFRRSFPRERDQVLGTRLGNASRVTERYANRVYGVDGVIIWPRLQGVIPRDFLSQIGDTRAQVDCFINLALLALIFALLTEIYWALAFSSGGTQWALTETSMRMAAVPLLALIFARIAYLLAIERTQFLGEQTRSAYDLYLPKLVQTLGYEIPKSRSDQSMLLVSLSDMFLYFNPSDVAWSPKLDIGSKSAGEKVSQFGAEEI